MGLVLDQVLLPRFGPVTSWVLAWLISSIPLLFHEIFASLFEKEEHDCGRLTVEADCLSKRWKQVEKSVCLKMSWPNFFTSSSSSVVVAVASRSKRSLVVV